MSSNAAVGIWLRRWAGSVDNVNVPSDAEMQSLCSTSKPLKRWHAVAPKLQSVACGVQPEQPTGACAQMLQMLQHDEWQQQLLL